MRAVTVQLVLTIVVIVTAFSVPGRAQDIGAAKFSRPALEAKIAYCKTCHGLSGQGYRGYLPMPRLAGQQPAYLENQLRAFIERRRTNPVMFNVAHVLSPTMVTALAMHFNELNPEPLGGAPRELIATGKAIYEDGLPEANVPACAACHGMEGKGESEIPRLAGQFFPYTIKVLTNWTKERGQGPTQDISALMKPTAHNLTRTQIETVAAYVSSLK
jgi:cytochrome c553